MIRRFVIALSSVAIAAGMVAVFSVPGGAQTGNVAALCNARLEFDRVQSEGKKAQVAALDDAVANAPAAIVSQVTAIRDAFKKKGYNGLEKITDQVAVADAYIYANCPGAQVPVTAIDYEFQNVPATLKPGVTNFKLTNAAPKEDHEMGIVKMKPGAESQDLEKLLALPEKKQAKYFDFSKTFGMFAPSGETGYTIAELEPGTYAFACFLPVGGKKNGQPHFTQGMYGTFSVA